MRYLLLLLLIGPQLFAQSKTGPPDRKSRPKLVVGLVVDQMRWDYLSRYRHRFAPDGGFRRMTEKGFSCENAYINYMPTYTACGHAALYTGTVPAIHGITGNTWFDSRLGRVVYCVEDPEVTGVGITGEAGNMSPRNLQVTTISDELRMATNFKGKSIGIAIKDRGGILPAGHSANAAYWYDHASGKFISSSWYHQQLPVWVNRFNDRKIPDSLYALGWNTRYPLSSYTESTADEQGYEGSPFGDEQKRFPYDLKSFIGKNYGALVSTPHGNTITRLMAQAAVEQEGLGTDSIPDMLAISFSSPDYIGHSFGPNSIEAEDNYLQLDRELGMLFDYLDRKVGKGEYLVFLSSDHGVAQVPAFLSTYKLPGGSLPYSYYYQHVDSVLKRRYKSDRLLLSLQNQQLSFNLPLMDSLKLSRDKIFKEVIDFLGDQRGVQRVFRLDHLNELVYPEQLKVKYINGYYPERNGHIQIIMKPGFIPGGTTGTTHGSPFGYDTHVPLLWYGWGVRPGNLHREVYVTDVAPTLASMLQIEAPNGSIGQVITELVTPK